MQQCERGPAPLAAQRIGGGGTAAFRLRTSLVAAVGLALGAVAAIAKVPGDPVAGGGPWLRADSTWAGTQPPTPVPDTCNVSVDHTVAAPEVEMGALFTATLTFNGVCTPPVLPWHTVMLVDASKASSPLVQEP